MLYERLFIPWIVLPHEPHKCRKNLIATRTAQKFIEMYKRLWSEKSGEYKAPNAHEMCSYFQRRCIRFALPNTKAEAYVEKFCLICTGCSNFRTPDVCIPHEFRILRIEKVCSKKSLSTAVVTTTAKKSTQHHIQLVLIKNSVRACSRHSIIWAPFIKSPFLVRLLVCAFL